MANIYRQSFDSKESWPIKKVTVYEDRAQITRYLDYKVVEHGEVELKLENLPTSVVQETVRAEVESSNVAIFEVACNPVSSPYVPIEESEREKEISVEITKLNQEMNRINESLTWMESYGNMIVPTSLNHTGKGNKIFESIVSEENLQNFSKSLEFYDDQVCNLDERKIEIELEIGKLSKEKSTLQVKARAEQNAATKTGTEATVLIQVPEVVAKEQQIATIKLFYVVKKNSCSWNAQYDVRVLRKENDVSINYYGKITNSTGEDWNEVEISLSTAKPSRPGNLRELPRAIAKIRPAFVRTEDKAAKGWGGRNRKKKKAMESEGMESICSEDDEELEEIEDKIENIQQALQEIERAVEQDETETATTGGSALFKLGRVCTIESDNKPHRQSIGKVKLVPRFSYVVSPKVSPNCFLKCYTRNESPYVLVPGDMAVFFNETFVTTSRMKLVNQKESFSVFLGIEESVKVDYQPEKSKDAVTGGGMFSAKEKTQTVSRVINIINTRSEDIDCQFFEQIPYPRDEKIKVELTNPALAKNGTLNFKKNKLNHLEGTNKLKANSTWKIKFDFIVTWPHEKEITFYESLENQAR